VASATGQSLPSTYPAASNSYHHTTVTLWAGNTACPATLHGNGKQRLLSLGRAGAQLRDCRGGGGGCQSSAAPIRRRGPAMPPACHANRLLCDNHTQLTVLRAASSGRPHARGRPPQRACRQRDAHFVLQPPPPPQPSYHYVSPAYSSPACAHRSRLWRWCANARAHDHSPHALGQRHALRSTAWQVQPGPPLSRAAARVSRRATVAAAAAASAQCKLQSTLSCGDASCRRLRRALTVIEWARGTPH
jgi:hypothetical protein